MRVQVTLIENDKLYFLGDLPVFIEDPLPIIGDKLYFKPAQQQYTIIERHFNLTGTRRNVELFVEKTKFDSNDNR